MPGKRFTKAAQQLKPDPRYQSKLVSKFVNCMMHDGKKSVAVRVFYRCMDIVAGRIKDAPPNMVFEKAIERGQQQGDIPAEKNRRALANYLVSSMSGLKNMVKAGADSSNIKQTADIILSALD